ncbi:MAG: AAA family ATPase [Candidatus Bathyarchaeota archaeon]|jgi:exonuclease SbcC
MIIESVELENIRSHTKSIITFSKGFNCLVGGLGCGKSSILYAIDFALLGEPLGRSYDYLLREDAKNGRVILQFSEKGIHYRISRGLERRGKSVRQDPDKLELTKDEQLIASGKTDAVAEQLRAITELDKELFREIVWIRQEHLKELLDISPRERQKKLDELFGLSNYENAWSALAVFHHEYEGEKRAYENDPDIARIETMNKEYVRTAEEFSTTEIQKQEALEQLNMSKKILEEIDSKLEKLERAKAATEKFRLEEAHIMANLKSAKETLEFLNKRIKRKKTVLDNLKQNLHKYKVKGALYKKKLNGIGVPPNQPIEALREHLANLDDRIINLKGNHKAMIRNIATIEKRINSLFSESRCPLCFQTITKTYKNDLMEGIRKEQDEQRDASVKYQNEIKELEQIRNMASNVFSNLEILNTKINESNHKMNEESKILTELTREFKERMGLEKKWLDLSNALQTKIRNFDLSKVKTIKTKREKAFEKFHDLQSKLQILENKKSNLAQRLDQLKEEIDKTQRKMERKEKISELIDIIGSIRGAYRSIQPILRSEFVKILETFVQRVLDNMTKESESFMNTFIDDNYTPFLKIEGTVERTAPNLSGGERTLLAFAYRLGLGQLIMQSRSGRGLSFLVLDEPTESLGMEDGSITRMAEAISQYKAIEQIIAVTHSEAFAEKADFVIMLDKECDTTKILAKT